MTDYMISEGRSEHKMKGVAALDKEITMMPSRKQQEMEDHSFPQNAAHRIKYRAKVLLDHEASHR